MKKYRTNLIEIIKKEALQLGDIFFPDGTKHKDDFYLHIKKGTLHPESLFILGELISDLIEDKSYDAVAGLSLGAIPIMSAVSIAMRNRGKIIYPVVVRKSKHSHGFRSRFEGIIDKTRIKKMLLVDDVIGKGQALNSTASFLRKNGFQVEDAIVVVDRGNGQKRNLKINLTSLITLSELLK